MTKKQLQEQIINDLKKDFPQISKIETQEDQIIIHSDNNTLWEIFEILYKGLDDVELNMGREEDPYITIKT